MPAHPVGTTPLIAERPVPARSFLRISVLLFLAIVYLSALQRYRAYDIDTPWFLSFSYNYCHGGIQTDQFQRLAYPLGMDGVHLFGKLAAYSQCLVLNQFGWTQAGVVGMNLVFTIVSLWLWWSFLARIGLRERWIACFILLFGVLEPTLSMVEKARYEFFSFFLLSAALYLASRDLEFAALLVAIMAPETEPAAVVVPIVVLILLCFRTSNWRLLALKLLASLILGFGAYTALHPGALHILLATPAHAHQTMKGGMISFYFVFRKRHLPELAVLLLGWGLYWLHRRQIPDRVSLWLGAFVLVAALLAPHLNAAYMVFLMPFLLWPALEGYDHAKTLRLAPIALCLLIILEYGYLYRANWHEGFDGNDLAQVRFQIDQISNQQGLRPDQVQIAGDHALWYAHPENYRAPVMTEAYLLPGATVFLCFDHPLMAHGLSSDESMYCPEMQRDLPLRQVSSLNLKGHTVHFLVPLSSSGPAVLQPSGRSNQGSSTTTAAN